MRSNPTDLVLAVLLHSAVFRRDTRAARVVLDRLTGKPRRKLPLDLPDGLATAADVAKAANALLHAVAAGDIPPQDAQRATSVLEMARRAVETQDLERRIADLEQRAKRR